MSANEGKKVQQRWKKGGWSLLWALVGYGLFQGINAALTAKEVLDTDSAQLMVCLSAGIAVFVAAMIGWRGEGKGRLILCVGAALAFAAVILLCTMAAGGGAEAAGRVAQITLAALLGGALAAALGGKGKQKKRVRRR